VETTSPAFIKLPAPRRRDQRGGNWQGKTMKRHDSGCAHCGGTLGLLFHSHFGLRFCRAACKESFLASIAEEHARMRKWLGLFAGRKN
jgi:hypothetical protein